MLGGTSLFRDQITEMYTEQLKLKKVNNKNQVGFNPDGMSRSGHDGYFIDVLRLHDCAASKNNITSMEWLKKKKKKRNLKPSAINDN